MSTILIFSIGGTRGTLQNKAFLGFPAVVCSQGCGGKDTKWRSASAIWPKNMVSWWQCAPMWPSNHLHLSSWHRNQGPKVSTHWRSDDFACHWTASLQCREFPPNHHPFLQSASPVTDERHHSCSLEGCFACPVTSAKSWPRPISDYLWYQWMELHFLQYYLNSSLLLDPNKRYGSPFKFFLPWYSPSALS